ncbi:MAG: hypothetical protein MK074_05350 [Phycisphaerales bacterium]|nr:hypothetical protein [Phycisphaerales bacterium]
MTRTLAQLSACVLLLCGCSDDPVPPPSSPLPAQPAVSEHVAAPEPTGQTPSGYSPSGESRGPAAPPQVPGMAPANGRQAIRGPAAHPPAHKPIEAGAKPPQNEQLEVTLPPALIDTINDPRYAEFRAQCRPYLQLRADMRPLELALATGTATDEQVAQFMALDAKLTKEQERLNAYIWQDHHSSEARRAMALIMTQPLQ